MDELLFDIFGEEQFNTVVKCLKTLSAFNLVEAWPTIEAVLVDDDNYDRFDKKRQIIAILREQLTEVLNAHWVFIEENTPLHIVNAMTYTLFDAVANYEPTAILNAVPLSVTDENHAEDAYVALVAYLHDLEPMQLIDHMRMVDATVLKNIIIALETKVIPDLETTDPKYKKRYLDYVGDKRAGVVYEYIAAGASIGAMGAYSLILILEEVISELSMEDLVFETASLLLISTDDITVSTIKQSAQLLVDDALQHDRLVTKLIKVLGVTDEA